MSIFLFRQKTAYEMRISDWSSDVCSSDLVAPLLAKVQARWMLPTRLTQAMQEVIQNRVIAPLLDDDTAFDRPPWFLRLFATLPLLRRLPARAIGLGRSEERRVGKECVSTCRSRWSPYL